MTSEREHWRRLAKFYEREYRAQGGWHPGLCASLADLIDGGCMGNGRVEISVAMHDRMTERIAFFAPERMWHLEPIDWEYFWDHWGCEGAGERATAIGFILAMLDDTRRAGT